jgi:hypothetical protein
MGQSDLPLASGEKHVKAFERLGWNCCAKTKRKNPHFLLEKEGMKATLSIPAHPEVKRRIVQKQIQLAGITEEEYIAAFYKRPPPTP